jgi:hypothetical protein
MKRKLNTVVLQTKAGWSNFQRAIFLCIGQQIGSRNCPWKLPKLLFALLLEITDHANSSGRAASFFLICPLKDGRFLKCSL